MIDFPFAVVSFKVWAMADSKRQGFLGFTEFIVAMQVVNVEIQLKLWNLYGFFS